MPTTTSNRTSRQVEQIRERILDTATGSTHSRRHPRRGYGRPMSSPSSATRRPSSSRGGAPSNLRR